MGKWATQGGVNLLRPAHTAESHRIGAMLDAMELAAARSATVRRAIVSFCGAGRQRPQW